MRNTSFAFLAFALLCINASAVDVMVLDKNAATKPFEKSGLKVHTSTKASDSPSPLPAKDSLDKLFKEPGLAAATKGWDQVDKDIYALSARERSLAELVRLYPKIPEESSRIFQTNLKKTN